MHIFSKIMFWFQILTFFYFGQVIRVDPTSISREFSSILANPAIATDVTCSVVVHKDMYVAQVF